MRPSLAKISSDDLNNKLTCKSQLQEDREKYHPVYIFISLTITALAFLTHMMNLPALLKNRRRMFVNKFILIYRNIFVMDLLLILLFLPLKICFEFFKIDLFCKSMRMLQIFGHIGLMSLLCILSIDR